MNRWLGLQQFFHLLIGQLLNFLHRRQLAPKEHLQQPTWSTVE
jgi:hypothetical protein